MYSDNARRLIAELPNRGSLPDATHSANAENPVCGDIIKLHLQIEGGLVRAARFECRGCPGATAAAAGITELVTSKTVAECRALGIKELESHVGELPPAKRHGLELAVEVLRACFQGGDR